MRLRCRFGTPVCPSPAPRRNHPLRSHPEPRCCRLTACGFKYPDPSKPSDAHLIHVPAPSLNLLLSELASDLQQQRIRACFQNRILQLRERLLRGQKEFGCSF